MSNNASPNGTAGPKAYDERILRNRDSEYSHLKDNTYLNNAERVPYAKSLVAQSARDLTGDFVSTIVPASRIDAVRRSVLEYFKADPKHFDIVFTQNATEAIKLLMFSCQEHKFRYLYHKDSHNSLVGVREVARGGSRCFSSDLEVEDWLENGDTTDKGMAHDGLLLFTYPAQSNMTGHRLPLSWSQRLRKSRLRSHRKAYALLDATSYLVTGRLDLSDPEAAPDFISISFNAIFGYPELGGLIVRKAASRVITPRRYFGAGTVELVLDVTEQTHVRKEDSIHSALEDGPVPTQSILALESALKLHQTMFGSANEISRYTERLTKWLHSELTFLRHFTGTPVVQVYNEPHASYNDPATQGAIIAFNIRDSNRNWISPIQFEKLANACGIQLRTGGIDNAGGLATMLELKPWEMIRNFYEQLRCGKDHDLICASPTGVIRVSLGPMTTMKDVSILATFVKTFFVQQKAWQPKSPKIFVEYFETDLSAPSDDYFDGAVPEEETASMTIQPIQGCNLFPLTQQHEFSQQTEAAYSIWNREWCILKKSTGKPIDETALELQFLQISVLPERGFLKITSLRDLATSPGSEKTPVRDHTPRIVGNTLKIDLWAPPARSENSVAQSDGRIADTYPQPEIASFFSAALNVPCTLARYRPDQSAMEKRRRTCVVPKCRHEFPDTAQLAKHYETTHVEEFDKEKRKIAKREKSERPPALLLSPADGEAGLGRSNSRGIFRNPSKRHHAESAPAPPVSASIYQPSTQPPYSPVTTEPERKSLDFLHQETAQTGFSPILGSDHNTQRPSSKSKSTAGGILRSLSKRAVSNPTSPETARSSTDTADHRSLPAGRKSLDRLNVYTPRPQHDRAKSEQTISLTPLINVEDPSGNKSINSNDGGDGNDAHHLHANANGGLHPDNNNSKGSWMKRHLSVRSTKEKKQQQQQGISA